MRSSRRPRVHSPSSKPSVNTGIAQLLQRLVLLSAMVAGLVFVIGFAYYTFFLPTVWSDSTAKNIVIVPNSIDVSTDSILYASISYKTDKVTLNSLPATDTVQVPGGYGTYPLKSVFPLLGLDHKSHQTVVATYSFLIGVPIDEVWVTGDASVLSPQQTTSQFAQAVLLNKMGTGLGLKDRFQLYQFIREQDPDVQVFASLSDWQAKQSSRFAGQLKDCRVALVNTTSTAGLGRRVSTVLDRSGVVVVRLTDSLPQKPKSVLTIQPGQPDCIALADHLKQLFPDEIEILQDPNIMERARSEAEVVIGQDLGNFLGN